MEGMNQENNDQPDRKSNRIFRAVVIGVVIFLLLMLLVLSLPLICEPHLDIDQSAQLYSVKVGLQIFKTEFDGYPPSDDYLFLTGVEDVSYGGAQKLAEALVGQDGKGIHIKSEFREDGMGEVVDDENKSKLIRLYGSVNGIDETGESGDEENKYRDDKMRKPLFIDLENANVFRLKDIYSEDVLIRAKLNPESIILCDMFGRKRDSGKKTGMPILYYRADASKEEIDAANPDSEDNIYCYKDNLVLLGLGVPGEDGESHPLHDPKFFYEYIQNNQVTIIARPYNADDYILISAGKDSLYGTDDDICNFVKK